MHCAGAEHGHEAGGAQQRSEDAVCRGGQPGHAAEPQRLGGVPLADAVPSAALRAPHRRHIIPGRGVLPLLPDLHCKIPHAASRGHVSLQCLLMGSLMRLIGNVQMTISPCLEPVQQIGNCKQTVCQNRWKLSGRHASKRKCR